MVNEPAVAALDIAIKHWLITKYTLLGVDEDGLGIYETPPLEWEDGDLDMTLAWDQWRASGKKRTDEDFVIWLQCARDRGAKVDSLASLMPKEPFKLSIGHVAIGVGGALIVNWLTKAPVIPGVNDVPVTDNAIKDLISPIAGG